jgi:hypothetical protein
VEGIQHFLRGPGYPALVYGHRRERAQVGRLIGWHATSVIRHDVIGRIDAYSIPAGNAPGDGGLPAAASASEPVDMPELPPEVSRICQPVA